MYASLVVICFLIVETGQLVYSTIHLTTAVYKFPFPVTSTFLQSALVYVLVTCVAYLSECFWPRLESIKLRLLSASNEKIPYLEINNGDGPHPKSSSNTSSGYSRTQSVKDIVFLSAVYSIKTCLSNVLLTRVPLPTYTLLRLGAIPLSLILNTVIDGDSLSGGALSFIFLATVSLVFAVLPFQYDITFGNGLFGFLLSASLALYPFLLLRFYRKRSHDSSRDGHPSKDLETNADDSERRPNTKQSGSAFWSTLKLTSLSSTVLLLPVLLLSGELHAVYKNCYILDIVFTWLHLGGCGILSALTLLLMLLLLQVATPVNATLLLVPGGALQLATLNHKALALQGWIDVTLSWILSFGLVFSGNGDGATAASSKWRTASSFSRNVAVAAVFYAIIYKVTPQLHSIPKIGNIQSPAYESVQNVSHSDVLLDQPKINNDYLGPRLQSDAVADITKIIEHCGEVEDGKGVDDVVQCLSYLATASKEYLVPPRSEKAATTSGSSSMKDKVASLAENLRENLTQNSTSSGLPAKTLSDPSMGTCEGPVFPFHVYWTGSASWRVELFVKAYLYTQNLPCSRLWLWLDTDTNPNAVDDMLNKDSNFQRFRPLVERGDIILRQWAFPHRIPLPKDNNVLSQAGLYLPGDAEDGGAIVGDGIMKDFKGQHWLTTNAVHTQYAPVAISDAVRFIVLHLHGGLYCDMDVLLLRDMRPMLLPDPASGQMRAFAEQWVERCAPSDYNTAVISLPANSSLSSYLLRGGLRMGMNFHPKVIGRMMWKDGRNGEMAMLHNAVFDPLVTNLRREGTDTCTVPCHKNFQSSFMGTVDEPLMEWKSYHGPPSPVIRSENDVVPAHNRTMEHFFRGAFAYHIHNQWWKFPEPWSWMEVITQAQDGFFAGQRTNVYGERWAGPRVEGYDGSTWPT